MPQLDPSSFPPQIFWLAVTFAILYWIMAKVALPRIGEVLQQRRQKVSNDLERAETLKKDAEAALEAYESAIAKARSEAQSTLAEATQEMAAQAAARNEEVSADIAKRTSEAEARIAAARKEALEELQGTAGELAQAIAARLVAIEVPDDAAKKAVGTAAKANL